MTTPSSSPLPIKGHAKLCSHPAKSGDRNFDDMAEHFHQADSCPSATSFFTVLFTRSMNHREVAFHFTPVFCKVMQKKERSERGKQTRR
jgi:hypothetical protein